VNAIIYPVGDPTAAPEVLNVPTPVGSKKYPPTKALAALNSNLAK
jgi:hypothetical protein